MKQSAVCARLSSVSRHAVASLILSLTVILLSPFALRAVKASPEPFMCRQPDGSEILVRLIGDEFSHYYVDSDGRRLLPDRRGNLSEVTASEIARRRKVPAGRAALERAYPSRGVAKALVVLVEFADKAFRNDRDAFSRMLNEPGFSDFGAAGSARDYFIENSSGLFDPSFDVYGPVKLQHPSSYYAANDDALAHEMASEALRALDEEVDFSVYDMDGDGWIDNVYIFYAGYGEADGGGPSTVWPHSSNLFAKGERITLDGVMAGAYACSNELRGGSTSMVGIGTFCHEFGHVLGLPDLYATNNADSPSPGLWSVMDHGNYCNNGCTPVGYSAYEKEFLGWCEPIALDRGATLRIEAGLPLTYRIEAGSTGEEYFLLECRVKSGWDAYLPGEGMLVWHIDYDRSAWEANRVNNDPDRQRVDLVEADGVHSANGDTGDPFPGTRGVSSVSLTSREGTPVPTSLSSIAMNGDCIYLQAGSETSSVPVPVGGVHVSDVTDSSATLDWDVLAGADSYYVTVLTEDNNRPRVLSGWSLAHVVGNRAALTGLQPDTQYSVVVRACSGITIGEASPAVSFTTDHAGLAFFAPELLDPSDITDTSFTVNWVAMPLATSYQVSVTEMRRSESQSVTASFGPGVSLPDGWTTNSSESISITGYYGNEAPALRLSESGSFVETLQCSEPFSSVSFWMRGYRNDDEARLRVKALCDGSWMLIDEIAPSRTAGEHYTYTPSGATAARLEWYDPAGSGSACIDDISLAFPGEMTKVTIIDNADSDGDTSFTASGLTPDTRYFFIVRGTDGELRSLPSEEREVRTLANQSGVELHGCDNLSICVDGESLTAESPAHRLTVTDIAGRQVAAAYGRLHVCLPKGIYIVKAGDVSRKVRL